MIDGNYIGMEKMQITNEISGVQDERMCAIVREYVSFVKESHRILHDTQRAAILAMGKIAGLDNGDVVEVHEDGSYIITKKEENMTGETGDKEHITLNGREVSKDELERQREAANTQKGVKLEETAPGTYRMRMQD